MSVLYELLDNSDDIITIEVVDNDICIDFASGVDQLRSSVSQMNLSVGKTRQLIEYLKQAIVDVKGTTT